MSDVGEKAGPEGPSAVVWDVGRVLYQWDIRHLFRQLIADEAELDWFLSEVVTEEWHFQLDAGRPLAPEVRQLKDRFPGHGHLIDAYATRFNETIPGPVAGTHDLVERLAERGVAQFALTNFPDEFWTGFLPTAPVFAHMREIVVSGREKCVKPQPQIYAIAEQRFGRPPQDLFFIDDKPENIAAATARDWHGHVFTGAAALEAELVRHGLLGA